MHYSKPLKLQRVWTLALALCLVFGCVLTGCTPGEGLESAENQGEEQEQQVRTVSVAMERVRSLNPVISRDEDSYYLFSLLYRGLFRLDDQMVPKADLAESWEYSQDGLSLTVTLKEGLRFSNGETLTARDVCFSIDCYISALYGDGTLYSDHVYNIKSATVKNDRTLVIRFYQPDSVSLSNLTFPILCRNEFGGSHYKVTHTEGEKVPAGAGPYKAESVDLAKGLTLVANEYYSGTPVSNTLVFRVVPDRSDAPNLFGIRDVSLLLWKDADRETGLKFSNAQIQSFASNETEVLGFAYGNEILQKQAVRQAISLAVDSKSLLNSYYYGTGVETSTLYYPGYYGTDSAVDAYPYDGAKAKETLNNAGYQDRDGDGKAEDFNGKPLTFRLVYCNESESRTLAAQRIASDLEKIGITVVLQGYDREGYQNALEKGQYELFLGGYRVRDAYDLRGLLSAEGNPAQYDNPELAELLTKMESACTEEEKRTLANKVISILKEDVPYYCLFCRTYGIVASAEVRNLGEPSLADPYDGAADWYLEY